MQRLTASEFSSEARDKIKRLCSVCNYISVRDKISQEFINNLGFRNTTVMPDLELVLEESSKDFGFQKEGPTVGIVLTGLAAAAGSKFWRDLLGRLQATRGQAEEAARLVRQVKGMVGLEQQQQ